MPLPHDVAAHINLDGRRTGSAARALSSSYVARQALLVSTLCKHSTSGTLVARLCLTASASQSAPHWPVRTPSRLSRASAAQALGPPVQHAFTDGVEGLGGGGRWS